MADGCERIFLLKGIFFQQEYSFNRKTPHKISFSTVKIIFLYKNDIISANSYEFVCIQCGRTREMSSKG